MWLPGFNLTTHEKNPDYVRNEAKQIELTRAEMTWKWVVKKKNRKEIEYKQSLILSLLQLCYQPDWNRKKPEPGPLPLL